MEIRPGLRQHQTLLKKHIPLLKSEVKELLEEEE
jgi:hypothetical protein